MPGVNVTTATRTGPTAVVTAPSGQFFVAGQAERGSTTEATLLLGFADFEEYFGNRVTYSHLSDTVKTFFEEGGSKCYAVRVVGPSATKATVTLDDASSADTLVVTAENAGAWGADIDVVVTGTTTKSIAIVYDGETKETFTGTTIAEILESAAGSRWVTITSSGSASVNPLPANGTFSLTGGTDDRSNITATHYTDALESRIALLDHSETATTANLITAADAVNSEYAGLFAPWVQISTVSGSRYIPPVGYIAAIRNRAHVEAGPFRAAAGGIAVARFVTGLKFEYTRTEGDNLDANKVNAIRIINNSVRNYGWRSLSDDTANYALLTGRDLLNRLVTESEKRLEQFVFQTVDGRGQLLSSINGTIVGIVEPYRQAGGLFEKFDADGNLVDPGYLVETGTTVNTLDNLANNEVKARLSVRISPSAALISVTIVKVGLLAGL